jgi:hypothetical protein
MFRKTITAALGVAMLAVPTVASAEYSPPAQIPDHAQCGTGAGSGAFGALGAKGDVKHDYRGGANGTLTGLNNSAVCGNNAG